MDSLLRVPRSASYVIALVTGRLTVLLNHRGDVMSITDQLESRGSQTGVHVPPGVHFDFSRGT